VHWLRDTFDLYTKPRTTGSQPLLILDGHGSHVSPEFVEYAEQHNIVPLYFPPHSTHHFQPLDVGLFSSLAKAYKRRLRETSMYDAVNVTISHFLEILYEARLEAFTPVNIAGAWRGAGLIPYDPTAVISKVQPTSNSPKIASAILRDTHGNEVSLTASTFATASKIDSLVAAIRRRKQSSFVDGPLT
jgi:DDE superfamily endonuclease